MIWARISMLAVLSGFVSVAHANDSERLLAIPCTGCHTLSTDLPPIFGQPAASLEKTMRALKAGEQASTVMARLLRGYSDAEITQLARILEGMPNGHDK